MLIRLEPVSCPCTLNFLSSILPCWSIARVMVLPWASMLFWINWPLSSKAEPICSKSALILASRPSCPAASLAMSLAAVTCPASIWDRILADWSPIWVILLAIAASVLAAWLAVAWACASIAAFVVLAAFRAAFCVSTNPLSTVPPSWLNWLSMPSATPSSWLPIACWPVAAAWANVPISSRRRSVWLVWAVARSARDCCANSVSSP